MSFPLALMLGAQVGQTLSGIQQANAQAKAANAEARSIADQAAFDEQQYRRKASIAIGKENAMGAASGLDITSGSPLFMELDNIRQAELDALNIRHQGQLGVASKQFQARMAKAQIPGIIMGGMAKSGSTLSSWWGSRQGTTSTPGAYGPGY